MKHDLEISWVFLNLALAVAACGRMAWVILSHVRLMTAFRDRVWMVDRAAAEADELWGWRPNRLGIFRRIHKEYLAARGGSADPVLIELDQKMDAPIAWGLTTVLMIPTAFLVAVLSAAYFFQS